MEQRPHIKTELKPLDKAVETLSLLMLVSLWVLVVYYYPRLPDSIPIHYNGAGEVDRFGGKATLFTLPALASFLFLLLTSLNRYPHIFNYATSVTEENAARLYANATRMLRMLKLAVVILVSCIAFQTIQTATGRSAGLGVWFVPVSIALVLSILAYFIVKQVRAK